MYLWLSLLGFCSLLAVKTIWRLISLVCVCSAGTNVLILCMANVPLPKIKFPTEARLINKFHTMQYELGPEGMEMHAKEAVDGTAAWAQGAFSQSITVFLMQWFTSIWKQRVCERSKSMTSSVITLTRMVTEAEVALNKLLYMVVCVRIHYPANI